MDIEYTGRHIEITSDLREYTEKRLEKLRRVLRDSCTLHLILEAEKHRRTAEITLKWRDHTLVGIEETSDPRSSINGALDKLERQAVRLLQGRWTKKRRPGPTAAVRLNVMQPSWDHLEPRAVIKTERVAIKPLSMEEAIESLEADSRELIIFRNVETERVNVVYQSKDGNFVVVEPEEA
jgi:putative sigma-54 modulation protein